MTPRKPLACRDSQRDRYPPVLRGCDTRACQQRQAFFGQRLVAIDASPAGGRITSPGTLARQCVGL